MDFDGLDRQLRDSLADLKLSNEERDELRQLGSELAPDQVRFLRNRAFDLVRELVLLEEQGERIAALKWLEQVVRTLEVTAAPPRSRASAYFSPGEECRRKIRELCRQARQSLDICVFTISDDQLSAEILACHRRGVPVRIISDDDKQFDEAATSMRCARPAYRCESTTVPSTCTTSSPWWMAPGCSTAVSTGPAAPASTTKRTCW